MCLEPGNIALVAKNFGQKEMIYFSAFVDIAAVLAVVSERVAIGTLASERTDSVATATVATNAHQQATLVHI
jgi:hypothetical protein